MKKLALLLVMIFITGCSVAQKDNLAAVQQSNSFSDFLAAVGQVTAQDVDTALADVHANGDVDLAALQCYPALKDFLKSNPTLKKPTVDGIISANQLKRDQLIGGQGANGSFQTAFRKLHVACAAYANDEARFAVQFLIAIGAASHGVPALPAIPGAIGALNGAIGSVVP